MNRPRNMALITAAALGAISGCTTHQTLPPRVEPYSGPIESPATSAQATLSTSAGVTAPTPVRTDRTSDGWIGSWSYFDQGPKIGPMVASAGYTLDVRPDRTARFSATGYQTDAEVECDVEETGESLRVIARRNLPGEDGEQRMSTYPPGKLLLVLRRARGEVATTWETVTPAFEGCASGKVCFKKDK